MVIHIFSRLTFAQSLFTSIRSTLPSHSSLSRYSNLKDISNIIGLNLFFVEHDESREI